MLTPGKENWTIVKRVFRHIHNMMDYAICYGGKLADNKEIHVHGFVDSEWDGDIDSRYSTRSYVFNILSGAISWMSRR